MPGAAASTLSAYLPMRAPSTPPTREPIRNADCSPERQGTRQRAPSRVLTTCVGFERGNRTRALLRHSGAKYGGWTVFQANATASGQGRLILSQAKHVCHFSLSFDPFRSGAAPPASSAPHHASWARHAAGRCRSLAGIACPAPAHQNALIICYQSCRILHCCPSLAIQFASCCFM